MQAYIGCQNYNLYLFLVLTYLHGNKQFTYTGAALTVIVLWLSQRSKASVIVYITYTAAS